MVEVSQALYMDIRFESEMRPLKLCRFSDQSQWELFACGNRGRLGYAVDGGRPSGESACDRHCRLFRLSLIASKSISKHSDQKRRKLEDLPRLLRLPNAY